MSRNFLNSVFGCLIVLLSSTAEAQGFNMEDRFTARPLGAGGVASGGDTLVEVEFNDGDDDKIKASGAFLLGIGVAFEFADHEMAIH
jgi:hypothetical protein